MRRLHGKEIEKLRRSRDRRRLAMRRAQFERRHHETIKRRTHQPLPLHSPSARSTRSSTIMDDSMSSHPPHPWPLHHFTSVHVVPQPTTRVVPRFSASGRLELARTPDLRSSGPGPSISMYHHPASSSVAHCNGGAQTERGRQPSREVHSPRIWGPPGHLVARRKVQSSPENASNASAASWSVPPIVARRSCSPAPVDVDLLLAHLLSQGLLSTTPRAPPWPGDTHFQSDLEAVRSRLTSALPAVEVRSVLRVECAAATDFAYAAAYAGVRGSLGPERLLWHGTSWDSVANIVRHGFNRAYCGRHGAKLGRGTYFTEDVSYALRFCGRTPRRAVFLSGVLPGRCCKGEDGLVEPPATADGSGTRFDSTVDDVDRPKVFCVFRDFQALPLYLAETT